LLVVSNHRGGGISAQAAWLTLAKSLAGPADGSGGQETVSRILISGLILAHLETGFDNRKS
jgi:hypothetical protein